MCPSNLEGLRKLTVPATPERHYGRPSDLTCITVLSLHEFVHNTNTAHQFQQLRTEPLLLASSILSPKPPVEKQTPWGNEEPNLKHECGHSG
jgi:hypothetical protein